MLTVKISTEKTVKPMKPMHGGGQPPMAGQDLTRHFHYLTEAGIPFSRLHDVGGVFGGGRFVDVPNVFRDFAADETDPQNLVCKLCYDNVFEIIIPPLDPYEIATVFFEN